jgi:hypothetical protein
LFYPRIQQEKSVDALRDETQKSVRGVLIINVR